VTTVYFVLSAVMVTSLLLGLVRVYAGPTAADRMLAAQLIGSTVVGTVLLLGQASGLESLGDVSLVIVLLAAMSAIAFVRSGPTTREKGER
jgi:multicomponent Na+:H+ antiporter subunit F